jgi:DUF4097 and DUF4098 domain-containing protein YvlB
MTTPTSEPGPATGTRPRPRGPNPWLVVGGLLTVLLLGAGALSVAGWLGHRTETQRQVYRQTTDAISVELGTGDITVIAGAADVVEVTRHLRWSYEKPEIDERWDGQTLSVTVDCHHFWIGPGCGVDYTLAVPEGVTVAARTSTGDITVRAILGELNLTTSTGDIAISGAVAPLVLHTSTGDVTVTAAISPQIDASSSTGDITLRLATGPRALTTRTSTGDIRITVPDGEAYRVHTDTSTGDVRVAVRQDGSASGSITAETSTGDIDINYG